MYKWSLHCSIIKFSTRFNLTIVNRFKNVNKQRLMTKFIFYWNGASYWTHLSNISSRNNRQIVPSFPASCKILTRWNSQCTLFEWVIYIEESFFPVEGGVSAHLLLPIRNVFLEKEHVGIGSKREETPPPL